MNLSKVQKRNWLVAASIVVAAALLYFGYHRESSRSESEDLRTEIEVVVSPRREAINQETDPARKLELFRESERFAAMAAVNRISRSRQIESPQSRREKLKEDLALLTGGSSSEVNDFADVLERTDAVGRGQLEFSVEEFRQLEVIILRFDEVRNGSKLSEKYPEVFFSALRAHLEARGEPGYESRISPGEFDAMMDRAIQSRIENARTQRDREIFLR